MSARADHWDSAYTTSGPTEVSWFDPGGSESAGLVKSLVTPGEPIIDVGGGASELVDHLLDDGYGPLTVLDVSEAALTTARTRLGAASAKVDWIADDVTRWSPSGTYALWHDRAVFHFLTEPDDRAGYLHALGTALRPGGHAVISTFAEDGPDRCSGLRVVRYAPHCLATTIRALAPGVLVPVSVTRHVHRTPGGAGQRFQTSVFRRTG